MNRNSAFFNKMLVIGISVLFLSTCITPSNDSISKASFIYKSNNPPYEPSNPIPPDEATNVHWNSCVMCTGGDPDGDLVTYDIYFENKTPPHKVISNSSIAIYCPPTMEFNTTYYWKVVAWDEHGAYTEGPIWSFTTRGNSPPLPPLIWTEGFTTFNILVIDPDGDEVLILIDWGDDTYEGWSGPFESGEIISISHVWPHGIYKIKLKARDIYNCESKETVYSGTISPDFKFFHVSIGYVNLTYKFTIYLEDYGKYLFDWGDGTYSDWTTGIADKSFYYPGEYEIKWKAMDIHGYETPWSNPILITILTLGNNPPSTPVIEGIRRFKEGEGGQYPYTINSTDPEEDNVCYLINWSDGTQEWTSFYESGEEITINVSIPLEKGTYILFKIKAKDIYDAESEWAILEITVPRTRTTIYLWYQWFLERFPLLERLLYQITRI